MFISFDGIDGTGKSTQCRLLAEWLRQNGREVTMCNEPGGTPLGEELRQIVLERRIEMTPACEAFLFMASRAELVAQVIKPALQKGNVVISDRFLLASVVYQGHAGGLPVEELWRMGHVATSGVEPELTLVLDMPVEAALIRRGRPADRIESRTRDYQEMVRQGFLAEAARLTDRIIVIDAQTDVSNVQEKVRGAVASRLK